MDLARVWLDAGVRLFQLRAKTMAGGELLELAGALAADARSAGATFIVNDRADIARLARAAGVHLGQDDLTPAEARDVVGPGAIVGVSTHNETQVRTALDAPVDYLAIGPVFDTGSKDRPDPVVGLDGVRSAAMLTAAREWPLVAIGGITVERAAAVLEAGATSLAVISDLLAGDPAESASVLWTQWREEQRRAV